MRANRKFINKNEAGVNAAIGVILMVAITVAIAATVYVYIKQNYAGAGEKILCGHIYSMPIRHTTDILVFEGIIYIIDRDGISDKDYAIMNYAYDNNCSITITICEYFSQPNMFYVRGDSAYLIGCGESK